MAYRAFRLAEARDLSADLRLLRLDGALGARAGEFAFLFLPGVGEKPFSVARNSPLSFLVRRRGEFTAALFRLEAGERLWVRGTYGAPAPVSPRPRAYLVAGGTGLAVVPALAAMLRERGKRVELYYGVSAAEEGAALEALGIGGELPSLCVPDSGRPGRVLEVMAEELTAQGPGRRPFGRLLQRRPPPVHREGHGHRGGTGRRPRRHLRLPGDPHHVRGGVVRRLRVRRPPARARKGPSSACATCAPPG